ncbi:MAG: hypothetical protein M1503_12910 [Thaumarchaeota archaeon]|nr:hypothetical protein [Nitrososphaerota archaeon]MCL5319138.1 hypothetical protein [Nitrososphaerota archaeon]
MQGWKCERCGYTHISDEPTKMPKKCPACRSSMLIRMSNLAVETKQQLSPPEIYTRLNLISTLPVQRQEVERQILKESAGIHILSLDERRGRLSDILPRKEAEEYLSLVRDRNFGLAIVGNAVIAVAPDSPIRMHVGVNQAKLDELEEAAEKEL